MGSQSKPTQPTMPDTIVPLVRRAVRRGSTTSDAKVTDINNDVRKLSIGGESSSEQLSPARLRRTVTSHDSQVPERRRSLLSPRADTQEQGTQQRSSITTTTPWAGNCFPATGRDNLPA